jgi:hypothetical protein
VAAFQRRSEHPIVDPGREPPGPGAEVADEYARGAALFYWWLDATYGREPGRLVRDVWALSTTKTELGAREWLDDPDEFSILRATFEGILGPTGGDDVFVRFAAARVTLGDDLPEARTFGAAARVDAWEIPWPKKPRWLRSSGAYDGIGPTGSTYIHVSRDGAPKGSRLHMEAKWETFMRMRWIALKLDADGKKIGEIVVPPLSDRDTEMVFTLEDLDATASVFVIGVSLGDPTAPFDPDDRGWRRHGWRLGFQEE